MELLYSGIVMKLILEMTWFSTSECLISSVSVAHIFLHLSGLETTCSKLSLDALFITIVCTINISSLVPRYKKVFLSLSRGCVSLRSYPSSELFLARQECVCTHVCMHACVCTHVHFWQGEHENFRGGIPLYLWVHLAVILVQLMLYTCMCI